jgi:hypothetical protein
LKSKILSPHPALSKGEGSEGAKLKSLSLGEGFGVRQIDQIELIN